MSTPKDTSDRTRHDVDQQLSFVLYAASNRLVRMHKPFLDPLGLTFPQYLVMLQLLRSAPRSIGQLGATLGLDSGTISPLSKRLERAGFVTRRRDAHDERRVLVDLTRSGEALRAGVWACTTTSTPSARSPRTPPTSFETRSIAWGGQAGKGTSRARRSGRDADSRVVKRCGSRRQTTVMSGELAAATPSVGTVTTRESRPRQTAVPEVIADIAMATVSRVLRRSAKARSYTCSP